MKKIVILLFICISLFSFEIKNAPIEFGKLRVELTKSYIKNHYGMQVEDIKIKPKIIVIHYTGIDNFHDSLERFIPSILLSDRKDISNAGVLNVSAHFMIDKDGTIYQLMPVDYMARHVIGLNYNSIGIENVGGENHKQNLSVEQLISNIRLINYLKEKFDSIKYVIAHYEYRCFEGSGLWLEKDKSYRTAKQDPGENFMRDIRANITGFRGAPCD